jgi:hypothetical protein
MHQNNGYYQAEAEIINQRVRVPEEVTIVGDVKDISDQLRNRRVGSISKFAIKHMGASIKGLQQALLHMARTSSPAFRNKLEAISLALTNAGTGVLRTYEAIESNRNDKSRLEYCLIIIRINDNMKVDYIIVNYDHKRDKDFLKMAVGLINVANGISLARLAMFCTNPWFSVSLGMLSFIYVAIGYNDVVEGADNSINDEIRPLIASLMMSTLVLTNDIKICDNKLYVNFED